MNEPSPASGAIPAPVPLAGAAAESAPVDPARVLAGTPVQTIANAYSDPGGRFHCGTWSSTPGRWRVRYTETEFCHLLSGRVRLVADDGRAFEYGPGDAWVIRYAIHEG